MELINPSATLMDYDNDPLKFIELVARNCYKSEDKITDLSAYTFVKKLYNNGHHAMLEFYPFYFKMQKELANDYIKYNSLPDVNGDFMISTSVKHPFVDASCNLRTAMLLSKKDPHISSEIVAEYPQLYFLFPRNRKHDKICTLVKRENVHLSLRYYTARFICDRGVSHEIVRHRKCSFAQESTRYCNYSKEDHIKFIIPSFLDLFETTYSNVADFLDKNNMSADSDNTIAGRFAFSLFQAEKTYFHLIAAKCTPQQARAVLPNALKTEIIVQAKLSEWKHIFKLRTVTGAHPDMIKVARQLRSHFTLLNDNINIYLG